jgi:hypothetical protein
MASLVEWLVIMTIGDARREGREGNERNQGTRSARRLLPFVFLLAAIFL